MFNPREATREQLIEVIEGVQEALRGSVPSLSPDTLDLLEEVIAEARANHGGHFTIMGFTTHFKVMFGTPELGMPTDLETVCERPSQEWNGGYGDVMRLPAYDRLEDALVDLLA